MFSPVIGCETNSQCWPNVVSEDVTRHTGVLKSDIYVISGEVKGRTLLPFSADAEVATNADYDQ